MVRLETEQALIGQLAIRAEKVSLSVNKADGRTCVLARASARAGFKTDAQAPGCAVRATTQQPSAAEGSLPSRGPLSVAWLW